MEFIKLLQQSQTLAFIVFGVLGLCVGSFLNVVIHRIPLMMRYEWRRDCVDILNHESQSHDALFVPVDGKLIEPIKAVIERDQPITLSKPDSRCPKCGHQIRWYENVPVFSWLFLRGRCASCANPISIRYPLIEIVTALLSVLVIYQFGVSVQALFALVFVWILIALTAIDFDTQYLPDRLVFPLVLLGFGANGLGLFVSPVQAMFGFLLGYLSLWSIAKFWQLVFKKQGMGAGDFKLLAALGVWLGAKMLLLILLLSSVLGVVAGLGYYLKARKSLPFAFGPYLSLAGIVVLFYGQAILTWYWGAVVG